MSAFHRRPVNRVAAAALLASTLLLLNGCGTTFRHRMIGSWIGPTMEYEFHSNGICRYAFRTDDGPRFMAGRWWVENASDRRAIVKFRRSTPSPQETYTFTAQLESPDILQLSKKRGKYRLIRSDHSIAGRFEGPWKGRDKVPYWMTNNERLR